MFTKRLIGQILRDMQELVGDIDKCSSPALVEWASELNVATPGTGTHMASADSAPWLVQRPSLLDLASVQATVDPLPAAVPAAGGRRVHGANDAAGAVAGHASTGILCVALTFCNHAGGCL